MTNQSCGLVSSAICKQCNKEAISSSGTISNVSYRSVIKVDIHLQDLCTCDVQSEHLNNDTVRDEQVKYFDNIAQPLHLPFTPLGRLYKKLYTKYFKKCLNLFVSTLHNHLVNCGVNPKYEQYRTTSTWAYTIQCVT